MEHGEFQHGNVYPECVHIPLLVSGPGTRPGRLKDLVQNIDVMPTILDWAGVPAPASLQGKSLKGLLERRRGASARGNSFVFSEWQDTVALRSMRWTYIRRRKDGYEELYDRRKDPGEQVNVTGRFPEILSQQRRMLADFEWEHPSVPITGTLPANLDADIKEHILKTGYW
jgi:arylsulfatase A-like enzyme